MNHELMNSSTGTETKSPASLTRIGFFWMNYPLNTKTADDIYLSTGVFTCFLKDKKIAPRYLSSHVEFFHNS